MTADQARKYIGLPWVAGGRGPEAYDCWGLLKHCRDTYFDVGLPDAPIGDEAACRQLFATKSERGDWTPVAIPEHGDPALLRGGRSPHVGIYLDIDGGGILHSLEGHGIIFTYVARLRSLGFGRTTFYRVIA